MMMMMMDAQRYLNAVGAIVFKSGHLDAPVNDGFKRCLNRSGQ